MARLDQRGPTVGSPADAGPDADPSSVARTIVLNALTAAPKTRAQLAELLNRRGVPEEIAEACLDRFEELRLINDEEFARMWVRSRHEGRRLSRRALRFELQRKGVARADIDAALEQVDDDDERHTAEQLARRKARATEGLARAVRHRRIMSALLRKGYDTAVAGAATRAALAESEDHDLDDGDWLAEE